jgi:hypothetical protein
MIQGGETMVLIPFDHDSSQLPIVLGKEEKSAFRQRVWARVKLKWP